MEEVLNLNLNFKTKNQVKSLINLGSLPENPTFGDLQNVKSGLKRTAIYKQIMKEVKKLYS